MADAGWFVVVEQSGGVGNTLEGGQWKAGPGLTVTYATGSTYQFLLHLARAQGFHGAKLAYGPYPTRTLAEAELAKLKSNPPPGINPTPTGSGGFGSPFGGVLTPIQDIGNFFHLLTEANTWIRVGEVLAGVLLVYIGLQASFRNTGAAATAKQATGGIKSGVKKAKKAAEIAVAAPK